MARWPSARAQRRSATRRSGSTSSIPPRMRMRWSSKRSGHRHPHPRGDGRDRGFEPPLSGGRRPLHDGDRAASSPTRPTSRRSRRPSPSSLPATAWSRCAMPSRARFKMFLTRAQKKDAACMSGAGGAGRAARGDHRPRGRSRRAHPGRGRQAVADHLRRQRRRAHPLAAVRHQHPGHRPRGRADLAARASACSRLAGC